MATYIFQKWAEFGGKRFTSGKIKKIYYRTSLWFSGETAKRTKAKGEIAGRGGGLKGDSRVFVGGMGGQKKQSNSTGKGQNVQINLSAKIFRKKTRCQGWGNTTLEKIKIFRNRRWWRGGGSVRRERQGKTTKSFFNLTMDA